MKRSILVVAALSALVALPAHAAPLVRGLGGPADFGSGNLPANDDGSTDEIDIRATIDGGGETTCDVEPVHPPGMTTGYDVTFDDPRF